jgi:SAM-dependent methyltransferase
MINNPNIFISPISGEELFFSRESGEFIDNSNHRYRVIENKPILIDFENSVISPGDFDRTIIERSSFYQSKLPFIKRLVSPDYSKTKRNFDKIILTLKEQGTAINVLIIGGGTLGKHIDTFYKQDWINIYSTDIYISEHIDFVSDAHSIPLKDASIDLVIIQYVLEHVIDPFTVVNEIHRVLKDKGIVYAETPFLEQVHEGPYDFTRFTENGQRYLFKSFSCLSSGVLGGSGVHLMWSIEYFFRGIFRSVTAGKFFKLLFFWLQYFDLIIPESYKSDSADTLFFMGEKSDESLKPKDIIKFYRGAY